VCGAILTAENGERGLENLVDVFGSLFARQEPTRCTELAFCETRTHKVYRNSMFQVLSRAQKIPRGIFAYLLSCKNRYEHDRIETQKSTTFYHFFLKNTLKLSFLMSETVSRTLKSVFFGIDFIFIKNKKRSIFFLLSLFEGENLTKLYFFVYCRVCHKIMS